MFRRPDQNPEAAPPGDAERWGWPRLGGLRVLVPLLLALAALLPYHGLLVGSEIPIPDDIFISDLADGDFPLRVEIGRLIRAGELPLWTPRVWTGYPLLPFEPLSLVLFAALPPALALGWYIAVSLLAAALGTYALARNVGASRAGAFLAGFAFSWSGFIVCHLRHLGTLAVVSLFPVALLCLEQAAGGGLDVAAARALSLRRRLLWLSGFAAVFGLQLLAGFPQSAYNAVFVYAVLVAARCLWLSRPTAAPGGRGGARPAAGLAAGALAAVAIGALLGMAQLLPLAELGRLSDRSGGGSYAWATQYNYWLPSALSFVVPYANGDISNVTYRGQGIFWEDYGYVGLATLLLALVALATRLKRFAVGFWAATGLVAYALVLGDATPLFKAAFEIVPGMATFRFPTRFLFIVELALALLGGLGLTALEGLLAPRLGTGAGRFVAPLVAVAIAAGTAGELVYHNRRQNPLVDADRWMERPAIAAAIAADGRPGRVYSPGSKDLHRQAFTTARGWSGDLEPYIAHREVLQPNSNLVHGIASLDGYAGIEPRWVVDLIGDHNRAGIVDSLHRFDAGAFHAWPAFFGLLEALSVRWVIVPFRDRGGRMEPVARAGTSVLHSLPGTLPRARIVERARIVPGADEVTKLLVDQDIDLRREAVLHDASAAGVVATLAQAGPASGEAGEARLVVDRATEVAIDAVAPRGGLLILSDTWYPGWEATVDGHPAPVLRANIAHRAVVLPPGRHRVEFRFRPRSVAIGLGLSAAALVLLTTTVVLLVGRAREPRQPIRAAGTGTGNLLEPLVSK